MGWAPGLDTGRKSSSLSTDRDILQWTGEISQAYEKQGGPERQVENWKRCKSKKNFFSLAFKFTFFYSIRGRVEESRTVALRDFTVVGFLEHNLCDSKAKNIKTAAQPLLNSNTNKIKKIKKKKKKAAVLDMEG